MILFFRGKNGVTVHRFGVQRSAPPLVKKTTGQIEKETLIKENSE
jgi:hypothetical protein